MSKMIAGILFIYTLLTMFSAMLDGGGGMNATQLTSDITATDTTIPVVSTSGFLPGGDYIYIGGEEILYNNQTNATNFYVTGSRSGSVHKKSDMVYCQATNILNNAMGFNVGATATNVGAFSVIVIPFKFFTTTIPTIATTGIPGLTGGLAWIGYLWFAITIGIVISLCISLVWVASGIVGKIT